MFYMKLYIKSHTSHLVLIILVYIILTTLKKVTDILSLELFTELEDII